MEAYLPCSSPEQHAGLEALSGARGKASLAKSWLQGESSGTLSRQQVTRGLIRDLNHMCTQCCVCFALNAQCVTHQMCPSGSLWPHQELEASTHVHQPTTLPQDILVHHLLEQTGTFQGWRQDVGNVLFRYGRDRGMKEALCSKAGTVTGKRRGREKGKQAAFATAPIYCNVGCRAAVLLHVMLVLSCASQQCMLEGTALWDEKSDCITDCWALTWWYCLGRGSSRAGT